MQLDLSELSLVAFDVLFERIQQKFGVRRGHNDPRVDRSLGRAGHHPCKIKEKLGRTVRYQRKIRVNTFRDLLIQLNIDLLTFGIVCHGILGLEKQEI